MSIAKHDTRNLSCTVEPYQVGHDVLCLRIAIITQFHGFTILEDEMHEERAHSIDMHNAVVQFQKKNRLDSLNCTARLRDNNLAQELSTEEVNMLLSVGKSKEVGVRRGEKIAGHNEDEELAYKLIVRAFDKYLQQEEDHDKTLNPLPKTMAVVISS